MAQQTVTAVDQKSGIFWQVSYSGPGTLTTGNYLLGEAWVSIPSGGTVSVTSMGKFLPGTTTIDPIGYSGPRVTTLGGHRDGSMKNPAGGGTLAMDSFGNDLLTSTRTGYDDRSPNGLAALFDVAVNDASLYIDPTGAITMTGVTNSFGFLGQVIDIPSSPSVIGTSLAIQAIVGTPSLAGLGGSLPPCVGTSNVLFFEVQP